MVIAYGTLNHSSIFEQIFFVHVLIFKFILAFDLQVFSLRIPTHIENKFRFFFSLVIFVKFRELFFYCLYRKRKTVQGDASNLVLFTLKTDYVIE